MGKFKTYGETMYKKSETTKSITMRIKNEYADKLQAIADKKNVGISTLARQIVENWIDEYTKNNA